MVTGMKTRRYKQLAAVAMMLCLAVPAHGGGKWKSERHELRSGYGLILAKDGENEHYQKKNSHQKEKSSRKEHQRKKYMSLKESAARVKKRMNGKVLSAHSHEEDGHSYHRIKVLTPDGVVRIILVDPESGDMN